MRRAGNWGSRLRIARKIPRAVRCGALGRDADARRIVTFVLLRIDEFYLQ